MSGPGAAVLDRLDTAVDDLLTLPLTGESDEQIVAIWQHLEHLTRRLAAVDHAVIGEVTGRGLAQAHGARSVASFARQALRISVREASARVRAAAAAGPRTALTGEPLPAEFPVVAAAQAAGELSPAHARIVVRTVQALPDPVRDEHEDAVEEFLVAQARIFDPDTLTVLARRLTDTLDPDGVLKDTAHRRRHRDLTLRVRPDGSSHLDGELTSELTEHLQTLFDTLARPTPATTDQTPDGTSVPVRDPRTPGQRRHDALLDAVKRLLRTGTLPDVGGISATIILTCTATDYATGTGTATTGHGARIPTEEATRWAGGDARIIAVALNHLKPVTAYSSAHRIFTETQRLAMIARDHGCSFPGCDVPPQWCQSHHITDHTAGGPTSVDNGTLLCSFHHREHTTLGWTCHMTRGVPHWTPPTWIDPTQTPQRNHIHNHTAALEADTG